MEPLDDRLDDLWRRTVDSKQEPFKGDVGPYKGYIDLYCVLVWALSFCKTVDSKELEYECRGPEYGLNGVLIWTYDGEICLTVDFRKLEYGCREFFQKSILGDLGP